MWYLLEYYYEIRPANRIHGMGGGLVAISNRELAAWMQNTGRHLSYWEQRVILEIDILQFSSFADSFTYQDNLTEVEDIPSRESVFERNPHLRTMM